MAAVPSFLTGCLSGLLAGGAGNPDEILEKIAELSVVEKARWDDGEGTWVNRRYHSVLKQPKKDVQWGVEGSEIGESDETRECCKV